MNEKIRPSRRWSNLLVATLLVASFPLLINEGIPEAAAQATTPPAAPTVAAFFDLDGNGHVDAIRIDFGTVRIDPTSVFLSEVRADADDPAPYLVTGPATVPYRVLTHTVDADCDDTPVQVNQDAPCLWLHLKEEPALDTGGTTFKVSYSGTLLKEAGPSGANFGSWSVNAVDRAPPVLVSAIYDAVNKETVVGFSEPVSVLDGNFQVTSSDHVLTKILPASATPIGASGAGSQYYRVIMDPASGGSSPAVPELAQPGEKTADLADRSAVAHRIEITGTVTDSVPLQAVSPWNDAAVDVDPATNSAVGPMVYIQPPGAYSATTNIGGHLIDVHFNCAVTTSGDDIPMGIAQPVGSGIIGIDGLWERGADSEIMRLMLSGPTESDGSPAFDSKGELRFDHLNPHPDGDFIAAAGSVAPEDVGNPQGKIGDPARVQIIDVGGSFFRCLNVKDKPDSTTATSQDPGRIPQHNGLELVDNEPPRLLTAFTKDVDRDGQIDQYELRFTEPVDTTQFDARAVGTGCPVFALQAEPGKTPNGADATSFSRDRSCETGLAPKVVGNPETRGHIVRISFQELTCGDDFLNPHCIYTTGEKPDILIPDALTLGTAPVLDFARPPQPIARAFSGDVLEQDGAPPLIRLARTQDNADLFGSEGGDGILDEIRIRFGEPVDASTIGNKDVWKVEGQEVASVGTVAQTSQALSAVLVLVQPDPNDVLATDGNTGARPAVVYEGDALADVAGNKIVAFEEQNFDIIDGAPPRVMKVFAKVGETKALIVFSEGIEAYDATRLPGSTSAGLPAEPDCNNQGQVASRDYDAGRSIVRGDIVYQNNNGAVGNTGLQSVEHGLGQKIAVLNLNQPLTADDRADQITPFDGRIREAGGSISNECRLVLVQYNDPERRRVVEADDIARPGDVAIACHNAGVNSVFLRWTAQGDDGAETPFASTVDPAAIYDVRRSTTAITAQTFDGATKVDADDLVFQFADDVQGPTDDGLGDPGKIQYVQVGGLSPLTTYHFAVQVIDDNVGFASDVSNSESCATEADTTPPEPRNAAEIFEVLSTSHQVNDGVPERKKDGNVVLTWTDMHDPESGGVQYRYGVAPTDDLIRDPDTLAPDLSDAILESTNLTDELDLSLSVKPGNWTFFVVAENAGGLATIPATYPLGIDPLVTENECSNFNRLLIDETKVVRENGLTTISWTISQDLADALFEAGLEGKEAGVQIWRSVDGRAPMELLDDLSVRNREVEGNLLVDTTVGAGDDSTYLVTQYYEGNWCRYTGSANEIDPADADAFLSTRTPESLEQESAKTQVIVPPPAVPVWVWLVIGIVAVLIIAGIVLVFLLRRTKLDESWLDDEELGLDEIDPEEGEGEEEELSDDPFGSDEPDEAADDDEDDNPFA